MLKNVRIPIYILISLGATTGGFFLTRFILSLFKVEPYSFLWLAIEIAVCLIIAFIFIFISKPIVDLFIRAIKDFSTRISRYSTNDLVSGTIGLIVGLLIAFLVSIPLGSLPFGGIISLLVIIFMGYAGVLVGLHKKDDINEFFRFNKNSERRPLKNKRNYLGILDTSVIIDGRIADVYRTGFLEGSFILPEFVLEELKRIADNSDPLRKQRGRRGMNILDELKEENPNAYVLVDKDYDDIPEVDSKIIRLAQDMKTRIFTNDYNLNHIARLQNIRVLNINDLALSLKGVVLAGEEFSVHIIKEGKESDQGIGYLDDGTMIVVENGNQYIGLTLRVEVTSVLQTSNGKMIFAKPSR